MHMSSYLSRWKTTGGLNSLLYLAYTLVCLRPHSFHWAGPTGLHCPKTPTKSLILFLRCAADFVTKSRCKKAMGGSKKKAGGKDKLLQPLLSLPNLLRISCPLPHAGSPTAKNSLNVMWFYQTYGSKRQLLCIIMCNMHIMSIKNYIL